MNITDMAIWFGIAIEVLVGLGALLILAAVLYRRYKGKSFIGWTR